MSLTPSHIGTVLLSIVLHFYFYNSKHIRELDYNFYDFISVFSEKITEQESDSYTVIVDIDEKSLEQLGQWPWSRVIDAKLIKMINQMNPSAIGVNILFPEKDRLSPIAIQKFYESFFDLNVPFNQFPDELKDNDILLSQSIQRAKATLSIYFQHTQSYTTTHCQTLSYQNNLFSNIETEFQATSLLCNHKEMQKTSKDFGFINAWTDSDGTFRRIPLFISYEKQVFPSFALATLLSFDKDIEIDSNKPTLLVNFSNKNPKIISAVDVLSAKVSAKKIQGKIVILGSSIVGLNPTYSISNGQKISSSLIHAFVIENILNNTTITQPSLYKNINLISSFLLSVVIIFLFSKKLYTYILGLFFITSIISFLWLLHNYTEGIYISIGYLWIPFLYFFLFISLYHGNLINQEKKEQEKFLIRQSKLASLGEMIALIAHQWRQPLSAINGIVLNIDIDYRKKILQANRLDEHLNKIEETTAYLSKTINDFTDFFSKNKGHEKFYIAEVLMQVEHLSNISNYQNTHIDYKREESIELIGYKSELIQSLLILLNNSIYACEKNLSQTKQGQITIDTYSLKNNLFISIEDNGGGIEIKNLKKIFNPYFTTKDKNHGTGLGLYILKLIIEDSMNGKISLENTKKGVIFIIQIPINLS
jgi:signal transduction histidine kinase/succinate dehydrogenase flavin-adding protein (antitoxin of CptAB toxin-antitoxin module)